MQIYPGQIYYPPSSTLVVQSSTTPCQFDIWKDADAPRLDVPPIDPYSGGEEYYIHHVSICYTDICEMQK